MIDSSVFLFKKKNVTLAIILFAKICSQILSEFSEIW